MRPVMASLFIAAILFAFASSLQVGGALADGPVDIRGTWSGNFDSTIGVFFNTFTFTTEDFTTGAVSGTANNDTYTLSGTVTGSTADITAKMGSYVSTSHMTVSPDGKTMTGSGSDTNGTTGTFTLTRQSGPPASPSPTSLSPTPSGGPSTGCTFGGSGGNTSPLPNVTLDPSIIRVVPDTAAGQALLPSAIAIDTGDPRGRVFVAHFQSRSISVISGRPLAAGDIGLETSVEAGGLNVALAADPATGQIFVADESHCEIDVLDGRASPPTVAHTIAVPGNPEDVAFDTFSGRLFVALPQNGVVLAFGADLTASPVVLAVPGEPRRLAVDAGRGFVFAATTTIPAGGATPTTGTIVTIDDRSSAASVASQIATQAPTAVTVDPVSHAVFAVETPVGILTRFEAAADGSLTRGASASIDSDPSARNVEALLVLPASHEVLVPLVTAAHANVFAIGSDGSVRLARSIPGIASGAGAVLDPSTGRVFIAELRQSAVAVATLDAPVQAAPSLATALPGPLEISLAPQDVARSVGITAFLMLLLGAPTPFFNSTLSAKRRLIERWLRRKAPRRLRPRGAGVRAARWLAAISKTWPGLALYLLLVTLLYSFLDQTFPVPNAALVFGMTLFGIAVGTAVSQLPSELYVRRRFGKGGQVRVALWVLVIAAACVLMTRLAGISPGYVYGIIGGFSFTVALTADDHGRMAFRGTSVLLAVGLAAWFLRIPFQPTVGLIGGDVGNVGNSLLADLFVSAVQGAAIGLIPLRFLTGETLFHWSRPRWAILWGIALVLFAHVILYPVSSFEPHPSATSLITIALTVVIYGCIAIGFWGFFARRDRRRRRRAGAATPAAR